MDNFIVSARKYRPATFNTVVGQGHITNTLKNAIKTGHLAQAFLFCGPRGVGKTTCARILAKTINCTNRTEDTEACDTCESCESFKSGSSLNVFELDAASNNGVDDIRSLIEQVRYAPQLGAYKVYVIDEVHMLSTPAFNAFLKTLEEPPKHAIFILATTEKHKIIPTILSRCQIFDFNRIQIEDIANHLAYIAKSENVSAEADALHLIAQKADGALRDACSIFDQIVSFAGNTITYKAVIDNLNILDYDYYFKVTDAILAGNISSSLLLFNEILNNGFDGHNFVAGMGDHFRNLLVSKDPETIQLLEVGNNIKTKYKEQSAACTLPFLVRAIGLLNKTDISYKASKNQRLQVELALMQLCSGSVDTEKKKELIKEPVPQQAQQTSSAAAITTTVTPTTPAPTVQQTVVPTATNTSTGSSQNTSGIIKKPFIKTTTTSISAIVNPEKKTEVVSNSSATTEPQAQKQVSQAALEQTWDTYANELKSKGKLSLAAGLLGKRPMLTNNNVIEFTINNKALEESINEDRVNLMGFLRQQLSNAALQINLILTNEEDKSTLYTALDKYKHLAEKNPNINKFRQAFDLDVEF